MHALISWEHFDEAHGWRSETTSSSDDRQSKALYSPEISTLAHFTECIPSWCVETPTESWIEVQIRVRRADQQWTSFYPIAQWDDRAAGSVRFSFADQEDDDGHVATDTLVLSNSADALQVRLLLYTKTSWPHLHALRVALSAPTALAIPTYMYTPQELPIPPRAQLNYPRGNLICSPTAVTMLLAYWYTRLGDPQLAPFAETNAVCDLVAPSVYDPVYEGYGNWSFNTAFAASCGLDAYVARLSGLTQVNEWISAGVPVVMSVAWQAGELDNAPIESSKGHLLVVAGFDQQGNVIVADPRGSTQNDVRRIYKADQLERAWQYNASGTVYLIHPRHWPVPALGTA